MRKLLRQRAAKWAKALRKRTHTVRNWTNEEAQHYLEAAWLAGARSLDAWHRQQTRKPVASSAFDSRFHVDVEPATEEQRRQRMSPAVTLTIPALGSRPRCPSACLACGWPCNSVGTCSNLGCPGLGGDA